MYINTLTWWRIALKTLSETDLLKREVAELTKQLYDAYAKIKELQEDKTYGEPIGETTGATN